ncbi:hypothetical protein L228DRAFT_250071 [Xylona heveae TC161]|uniref:Chromatin assembly factor 1 subunit A n=1 Tax=Xylona heveae (strain CBS 132557 / TC161) TaxID=1328760 RepID=A0A165AFC9_XYLHT|nr:hypothetical protein L228DRAFT_250071 [Xylona heveae TC161]KZF20385.1 hypothetical protein L228DRAFT_250071 [Xylona heveae TC161]
MSAATLDASIPQNRALSVEEKDSRMVERKDTDGDVAMTMEYKTVEEDVQMVTEDKPTAEDVDITREQKLSTPASPSSASVSAHGSRNGSMPPESTASSRLSSPELSDIDSTKFDDASDDEKPTPVKTDANGESVAGPSSPSAPPTKKRKLTFAEREEAKRVALAEKEARRKAKEERAKEREEKEKEKSEQRAKKEEEKRAKEEERRKKDEQREEKRKAREVEKLQREGEKKKKEEERRAKELEKQKKEEEKNKKEKAQLRLNAFFAKPAPKPAAESGDAAPEAPAERTERPRAGSPEARNSPSGSRLSSQSPGKTRQSDYRHDFQSFFLHPHTRVAPINRFSRDREALQCGREKIDSSLQQAECDRPPLEPVNFAELLHLPTTQRCPRGKKYPRTARVIAQMHGSSENNPVDLTGSGDGSKARKPTDMLKDVPLKYLRFAEDVRPPYVGTFSRQPGDDSALRRGRNPFQRALPETNYDYDSEAEWVEPEEGEELNSEGEEELSEDDGDDLEGFLDDEGEGAGTAVNKRRLLTGDLEPVSTGLCWAGSPGDGKKQRASDHFNLHDYKMEIIHENHYSSINPFSTEYWQKPEPVSVPHPASVSPASSASAKNSNKLTDMLRPPLHAASRPHPGINTLGASPLRTSSHSQGTENEVALAQQKQTPSRGRQVTRKASLSPEELVEFKQAVHGSDLTKAGLIEVLKKRFPKHSKDIIKDTLTSIAQRVGTKEADKRWAVLDGV